MTRRLVFVRLSRIVSVVLVLGCLWQETIITLQLTKDSNEQQIRNDAESHSVISASRLLSLERHDDPSKLEHHDSAGVIGRGLRAEKAAGLQGRPIKETKEIDEIILKNRKDDDRNGIYSPVVPEEKPPQCGRPPKDSEPKDFELVNTDFLSLHMGKGKCCFY